MLVDVEESIARAGLEIAAGIRNRDLFSYLSDTTRLIVPGMVDETITSVPFLIPLFAPANRLVAYQEATCLGFAHPHTLVDPTAIVPRTLDLGAGTYINAGCLLGAKSCLGAFAFVNRGASIGHHAAIGDFVSIGPGAVIAGQVTIGDGVMIGAGATILPGISIGDRAAIGAGSVVTRDVPPGCRVVGNPARGETA